MDLRAEPQQRRSRDKRDRVLTAAEDLLKELPYEAVGTKLIAARAGVSVGSLYRFFVDKQAIINALAQRWLDEVLETMDALLADLPPEPAALVDRLVDTYAQFWRERPDFRAIESGALRYQLAPGATESNDAELTERLHTALTGRYRWPADPHLRARLAIAINVTEHLLNLAFSQDPEGDPATLSELKLLLRRYLGLS